MHGTRYEERGGRLVRVIDRAGACHAELTWDEASDEASNKASGRLVRLAAGGVIVEGAIVDHPLLGAAHAVGDTAMTALDWVRPTEIPAIAEPARLPLGAGGAILNTIALLARRAGVTALRYAGPYPTAALWKSLARSFRCEAGEAAFTAGALDRAVRVARDVLPVDFAPAPHERLAIRGGFVELRDGIERAVIDGVGYEPAGSPARLVGGRGGEREAGIEAVNEAVNDAVNEAPARAPLPGHEGPDGEYHCEIWFGDACYARVATLAADGRLVDGPHAIPACTSPVVGRAFPDSLGDALAELVADAVPAPLAGDARALCAAGTLCWADLGARAARELPGGFAVHAALWDRVAPLGLSRLALALAEALAPVVAAAVVRRVAATLTVPA